MMLTTHIFKVLCCDTDCTKTGMGHCATTMVLVLGSRNDVRILWQNFSSPQACDNYAMVVKTVVGSSLADFISVVCWRK